MLGSSNDVDTVVVGGRIVLQGGKTLILDAEALRRRYVDACLASFARQEPDLADDLRWMDRVFLPSAEEE